MIARGIALVFAITLLIGISGWLAIRATNKQGNATAAGSSNVELAKHKQVSIWDAEHVAFEIESRFGKPFCAALRDRDAQALIGFFSPNCRTRLLETSSRQLRRVAAVTETRQSTSAGGDDRDAAALVTTLFDLLQPLDTIDRIRLRALKVRKDQTQSGRWQTKLLLEARGLDEDGQVELHRSEHAVSFALDAAAQIATRGIIVDWSMLSATQREAPQPLMEEVTSAYGLQQLGLFDNWKLPVNSADLYQFQMAVEDFNRDGFLDIAIASGQLRPILLRSEHGTRFTDVTAAMGLRSWQRPTTLVTWIDFDNDSYPDLWMGDRLYRNVRGEKFEPVLHQGVPVVGYDPMEAVVGDYDCDGKTDLYILYQHGAGNSESVPWVGDEASGLPNQLWRNEGDGLFQNVTLNAGAAGGRRLSFAATWLFLDDDRFPDLYIANDFARNVLLRNTGQGMFADVTRSIGGGDFATSMGVAAGDINNDGSPEIYVANMYSKMGRRIIDHIDKEDYPPGIYEQILGSCAGNRMYTRSAGESKLREISEAMGVNAVGWAFGPAFADFDNNGWLDLYAATGYLSFSRTKPDG